MLSRAPEAYKIKDQQGGIYVSEKQRWLNSAQI